MHPTWRCLSQSTNAAHHCHCSFGVATCGFHKHWDDYGFRQTTNMVSILVFCDHFMKHIMAYMTPNQTAKTVAMFLWQGYISIFGTLAKLLGDWGTSFESNVIKELCELLGIQKVRTSPYHAQTNGQVEQAHQMLMHMIGKLSRDLKADWPKHLQNWYMPITPRDQPSPDTAHTTWYSGTDHTYPSTLLPYDEGHGETPVGQLPHC